MRVGRQYLGQMVEIRWSDPNGDRVQKHNLLTGQVALAKWKERGVIDDITDGVVRLMQSEAAKPGADQADEYIVSYVPEALITEIVVFQPVSQPAVAQPPRPMNGEVQP